MVFLTLVLMCQTPMSSELLQQASAAWAKKDAPMALSLANQAIEADPKNKLAYLFRGMLHESRDDYAAGVSDWTKVIELDPTDADARHARGCLNFKAGRFADSLADFDAYLQKRPDRAISHWQRGITCYYVGKFDEGRKQFEGYQDFDSADVENAVWRFMCMTKSVGLEKARQEILKIGDDKRVPMRDIYELYAGRKTPDDVMVAAKKGDPAKTNMQLFYAHLYLGIWYDLLGESARALEHLNQATDDYRIGHYMWDVARVHRDLLKNAKK